MLNGEPYFPLGLYVVQCTNGSYTKELEEIADSPFDTVMNYGINGCGAEATAEQINAYLDELRSRDLKAIFSLQEYFSGCYAVYQVCDNPDFLDNTRDTIIEKVTLHKDHESVLAWYLYDEVCPNCLEQLEVGYGLVKALDNVHPAWTVHWNTSWLRQEAHTTDIVGVDPYPIDNHPITLVSQMADAANLSGKPLWLVPQIFDWRDQPWDPRATTGRPPTQAEMRAMSYLATNHGAKGLVYYSYFNIRNDTDYDVRWPEIKDIAGEIDTLKPVFLSTDTTNANDVICDNGNIDVKLMKKDDRYYLFAVNKLEQNVDDVGFVFGLPNTPCTIDLLFEDGRKLNQNGGSFRDSFGVYEVHVYTWKDQCPLWDLNCDGGTDGNDLAAFALEYGMSEASYGTATQAICEGSDGDLDGSDLASFTQQLLSN